MNIILFAVIMVIVCLLGFFNEKVTKLNYEISLMLFSVVIGGLLLIAAAVFSGSDVAAVLARAQYVNVEGFLMEGVLCFMLFASSCHMKLSYFRKYARQVTVLSLVCTLLGACFYGLLFFGAAELLRLELPLPVCLLFGNVVFVPVL